MRNSFILILINSVLFFGGCASYSTNTLNKAHTDNRANNDEQIDLYLSTLDDKHFVWCELDLDQCRKDFEQWKRTPRGRMIIREYEKEDAGQTYNTHQVSNVFRTHFVDERQFEEDMEELEGGQASEKFGNTFPLIEQHEEISPKGIHVSPQMYGPKAPSNYEKDAQAQGSP